jgi:3-oxoacyl-(acyl-carrier-protein) synthase
VDLVVGAADGGPDDGAEAAALHAALSGDHAGARVTAPAALLGSAGAVSGAAAIAIAALALRAGVTPGVAGLADPEHGPAERYAGAAGAAPRTALALTAAPGSVRGGVLLGGAW